MNEKLSIAIYSTQVIPTNPELAQYGGLELISGLQAKYFAEQGHDVHLFASLNSYFSADKEGKKPFENGYLYAVGMPGKTNPVEAWKSYWDNPQIRQVLKDVDICIDHSWNWYPYSQHQEIKNLIHITHGPDPGFKQKPPMEKPCLVGVSHSHAKRLTEMSGIQHRGVPNGILIENYPFKKEKGDYFLWLSRIYEPKGAHRFIDICNKAQVKGVISGGSFGDDRTYVERIKKMVAESQYVTTEGQIGQDSVSPDGQKGVGISHEEKVRLYQDAKAIILPIVEQFTAPSPPYPAGAKAQFIEPYGLIIPEAGACGTPTIVVPSGGWMESLVDGINGFYANDDMDFINKIRRIENGEIKAEDCRQIAEWHSYQRMGENYLHLIREILSGNRW